MIGVIFALTAGQLLRQRRTLLLLGLAALPVALGTLYRFTADPADEVSDFAAGLMAHFIVALIMPLTALVVGTAALGQELEDGTVVYLIAKPLPRWKVVLAKIGAAWVVTAAVVLVSVVATGLIVLVGRQDADLIPAFAVAVTLGALAYVAVFTSLSISFGRALIIGLVYVFVWEALLSQLITGVRFFSIRAYTLSIADALSDSTSRLMNSPLGVTPALILLAGLTALATLYAVRRLGRYQMSERV